MTCKTIMLSNPRTLVPDDTVPKAIELMLQYGMRNLPVVDGEGRFLGLFTAFHLIKLLLPQAATMVSIDCQSFAISLVDLLCRWRGGWFIQFAPQQRLYLRPLPQGHGSFRPTFFPVGVLAALPGCLRAFQNSCMPLMA